MWWNKFLQKKYIRKHNANALPLTRTFTFRCLGSIIAGERSSSELEVPVSSDSSSDSSFLVNEVAIGIGMGADDAMYEISHRRIKK
jgi:hypothetical protein